MSAENPARVIWWSPLMLWSSSRAWRIALVSLVTIFVVVVFGEEFRWGGTIGLHWWVDSGWTLAGCLALAACLQTSLRTRGSDRAVWMLFSAGCTSWVVGQFAWDYFELFASFPPSPALTDIGSLGLAPAFAAGLIGIVKGSRIGRVLVALDIGAMGMACAVLFVTLYYGDVQRSTLDPHGKVTLLLYPILYAALSGPILSVRSRRSWRGPSQRLMLLGIVMQAVPFILWTPLLLGGTWREGTILDSLWMFSLLLIAASARSFTQFSNGDHEAEGAAVIAAFPVALSLSALLLVSWDLTKLTTADATAQRLYLGLAAGIIFLVIPRLALTLDTNRRLFAQSRRDSLTHLGNRLRMREDLETLQGRVERYGHEYSVVLFDIDHFKQYNDQYGHQAGDRMLRTVARLTRSHCRPGDVAYRYGGEEFLIVLPAQSLERASVAAERLRCTIENAALPHASGTTLHVVTISAGVASLGPGTEKSLASLLHEADDALYRAKRSGRNQVATHVT